LSVDKFNGEASCSGQVATLSLWPHLLVVPIPRMFYPS
jgi:hypothetical protein